MEPNAVDDRIRDFLGEANLSPPPQIARLSQPEFIDFKPTAPENSDVARSLLVQHKIQQPGYRPPERMLRNKFSTRRLNEKSDQSNWTFTKHEVAKTFDGLLSRIPLVSPGVAQGVLSCAPAMSLDDLWCHLHDPNLQKRQESRFRRSRPSLAPEISWLQGVTELENLDYIHLMCQVGLGQDVIDKAFDIALSKHSLTAMEVLLSYGANASPCRDTVRDRVKAGDMALVKLLLSAPGAMTTEAWRHCLQPKAESFAAIVLLCVAHRPDIVCGTLLMRAMESRDYAATAAVFAYAGSDEDFCEVRQPACISASEIENHKSRTEFFALLNKSGCVEDNAVLREELMKDVKLQQYHLLQILADARVSVDVEPNNAVSWTVSRMDLKGLEMLQKGRFSSPASLALNMVPDSAAESQVLRIIEILAPKGLAGEPLHSHLGRAVRKQHAGLVEALIRHGASTEFDEASAIRTAVENADFDILAILLRVKCSPAILSTVVPTAVALQSRPQRLRAVHALLEVGVLVHTLGLPLQTVVSENGDADLDLIRLLLQHKAPVENVGDDSNNSVLIAARRGELSVLKLLCDAWPRNEYISKAVPVAFSAIHTCGYDVALGIIQLLLDYGASGEPIHQLLLAAVEQDSQMDIVRILLEHGADANYNTGAAYTIALQACKFQLLEMLCLSCAPSQETTESVLFTAIDARYFNLPTLELLLSSTWSSAAALNSVWASEKFKNNRNMATILPCFLQHGLNVDLRNGDVLCFAIHRENVFLLRKVLLFKPTTSTLAVAFQAATEVKARYIGLQMMELLLDQAQSTDIGQSQALLGQTRLALTGDLAGLELLLRHGAAADFDDGAAIQAAAVGGSVRVLHLLFGSQPTSKSLNKACLAAASSSLAVRQKDLIFEHILAANKGILAKETSTLLDDSVRQLPEHTQLPVLLLGRGTHIEFATLECAIAKSSRDLFMVLANGVRSQETISKMFNHFRVISLPSERRIWICRWLLDKGLSSEEVSEALLDCLRDNDISDLTLPKLLLQHGAMVEYNEGKAFSLAIHGDSVDAVKLLSQYIVDDRVAGVAFDYARKSALSSARMRLEIYHCLMQWNIEKAAVYDALVEILKSEQSDKSIVQLLLNKGADPNRKKAECFILASEHDKESEFRTISRCAKLDVVLQALLAHFSEESRVMWWFSACLEEQAHTTTIDNDDLLFQCLRKFPKGTSLLKLLLDNGVSPSVTRTHSICNGWQPEECTALIWALVSKPEISNATIVTLLARAGLDAHLDYTTSSHGISAAFCCLLDKKRTPVLEFLLDIDRERVMSCEIPGQSLGYLGAFPNESKDSVDQDRVNLRIAALLLGNFDAFCLLDQGPHQDDGALHLAALLALPNFVDRLLGTYDPNSREEWCDQRIPLAMACAGQFRTWCKFANDEFDFKSRQKRTMHLLAPVTDAKWRYRGRTVLHHAFDHGPETTMALINALEIQNDPKRFEKYIYLDKEGKEYLPEDYVVKKLDVSDKDKLALISCLAKAGLRQPFDEKTRMAGRLSLPPSYTTTV